MTQIQSYREQYREQVIDLILSIQNDEAGIGLTLEEQPDLLDISASYLQAGGGFWLALEGETVVGTIALMNCGGGNAVLKKFFVRRDRRRDGVGGRLYEVLLRFARTKGIHSLLLDTPSVATASHRFYERVGFRKIAPDALPFPYRYPDRNSILYLLRL